MFSASVSLNSEKNYCEISKDEIAVGEKTAGLGSRNFLDLNSACQNVLVPSKILQFQDMLNESVQFRDETNGLTEITGILVAGALVHSTFSATNLHTNELQANVYLIREMNFAQIFHK